MEELSLSGVQFYDLKQKEENGKGRVGDKLRVIDNGASYTTFESFIVDSEIRSRYKENFPPIEGKEYRIVEKGFHTGYTKNVMYVIENEDKEIYIIGYRGIELIKSMRNKFDELRRKKENADT